MSVKENRAGNPSPPPPPRVRRVVVAGYGPVGRVVVDQLENAGVDVTIVELNLRTIERLADRARHRFIFGDITDEAVQREAGVPQADALILTVPDECAAVTACEVARKISPGIFIAARTNYLSRGMLASQAGADHVVVEEVITAQAMKAAVLERFLNNHAHEAER